jgi:nucleotide-binding universal stress UspA family protein
VRDVPTEPIRQFTPGDEIAAALSRHGVKVDSRAVSGAGKSVRDTLNDEAREFGADLLVMGCYGHSRVRERVLGGVSRDILANVPLPLLLSN